MKLSLGITTSMPIEESIALARAAEEAGYSRVWLGEDIFHREMFTYLSVLSLNTSGIGLGSGITSPYVRKNQVIATSALTVSKLCRGRFVLGLGTGGLPEVQRLTGKKPVKPRDVLKESVRYLRKKLDLNIYLGVRGPKMLSLAGQISDGVILSGPGGYIETAINIVDSASKGRDVKKVLWNAFFLGENDELVSKITHVMLESMPEFALQYMQRDRAEKELCVHGSKEGIVDEIRKFEEMGVDEFVIGPPYGDTPLTVIEEIGDLIGDRHKH